MKGARVLFLACVACGRSAAGETTSVVPVASVAPAASADASAPVASESSCDARVRDLSTWMRRAASEGEFELEANEGKDFFATSALPPAWTTTAPVVRVTAKTIDVDGRPLVGPRADAVARLREELAARRKTAKALGGPVPDGVTLRVARDAPFGRLAEAADMLEGAGETKIEIVVRAAKSDVAPPPRSSITDDVDELSGGGSITPESIAEALARSKAMPEIAHCEPARRFEEELSSAAATPRSKAERIARELPERIRACGCAADLDAVRTRYWALLRRNRGIPLATIPLTLDDRGAALEAGRGDPWQSVVDRAISASHAGKPAHFVAR